LRRVLPELPDVAEVLAPEVGVEPFFVKAVDEAQGDTRDAVVLSVGYGRTPHGRVLHRFGAIGEPGGERRLAVAATRARRRMTVVSAFGASDLDPARLSAEGPRLLRDLLAACEVAAHPDGRAPEGGAASAEGPDAAVPTGPDAVLEDLATRLRAQGLRVAQGYGTSGSGIDLAVGEEGGPLLVAVEADGPAYAATASTRERDRLRVEHLQRLGWTHLRIWTTDVFRDPAREVARVVSVARAAAARDRQRRAGAVRPSPVADWARVRWDGDRAAVPPTAQPAVLSGTRPSVPTGRPIEEYSAQQLDDVVRWICGDTLARTDEQVAALARQHLGFVRRGSRVDAALAAAIARVTRGAVQEQGR
jgi:REase_MTES_1575